MKKISVYCELDLKTKKLKDVSYELISKAYELTQSAFELKQEEYIVEAIILGDLINDETVHKMHCAGANNIVFIKEKCLENFSQTVYSQAFVEYFQTAPSEIIIFPATPSGRMVAPRITTMLDTGLVADCTGLDFIIRENKLNFAPTRPTFGSELMATILSKKNPQCATVRPQTFVADFNKNIQGEYKEFHPTALEENRIRLLKSVLDENHSGVIDFSNAKIVLAAGYGLCEAKNRIYFEKLEEIAKKIGATVGSTRKVVDMGLMPHETQIGLTGTTVVADLYIAFGISGALQHTCGMKNSKIIVGINTDNNAEIFNYCDYKIVTDAKAIIDELHFKLCAE